MEMEGCSKAATMLFLAIIALVALVGGVIFVANMWTDARQADAVARVAEAHADEVEAREQTERKRAALDARTEARRDYVLALAAFTNAPIGLLVVMMLAAAMGGGAIYWMERRGRQ